MEGAGTVYFVGTLASQNTTAASTAAALVVTTNRFGTGGNVMATIYTPSSTTGGAWAHATLRGGADASAAIDLPPSSARSAQAAPRWGAAFHLTTTTHWYSLTHIPSMPWVARPSACARVEVCSPSTDLGALRQHASGKMVTWFSIRSGRFVCSSLADVVSFAESWGSCLSLGLIAREFPLA